MRVILYLRVSTPGQVEGESLNDQENDARRYAADRGWSVVGVYSDPGLSGTLPAQERPGLLAALVELSECNADVLLMRDLDRLARDLSTQEAILGRVWECPETSVYTLSGEVLRDDPDDPMRRAMRQMRGVFHELDKNTIVKRLRDARRHKEERGQHANGPAPYGWRTEAGELFPVRAEQACLNRMLSLRAGGATQTAIAETLNAEGFRTRGGWTSAGRVDYSTWTQPKVSAVLRRHDRRTPARKIYETHRLVAA